MLELGRHEAVAEMHRNSGLVEVSGLIEAEPNGEGWNRESARLFAIDVAMLICRRNLEVLDEQDRHAVFGKLTEARRLVVDDRDLELEWILSEFEPYLSRSSPSLRPMWLTVMNALLPCPYRSAIAVCRSALISRPEDIEQLSSTLRQRLQARLGEGVLLDSDVFAVA